MTTGTYIDPSIDKEEARRELLKQQVSTLNETTLVEYVNQLEEYWCLSCKNDRIVPLMRGFKQFFGDNDLGKDGLPINLNIEQVNEKFTMKKSTLKELFYHSQKLKVDDLITNDINDNEYTVLTRISRLIECTCEGFDNIFGYVRHFDRVNNPTFAPTNVGNALFKCSTIDFDETSSYQQLILAMLNEAYIKNYRRYKSNCCKQIVTPDGYNTKAWKPVMDIQEFVYDVAQKETNFVLWKHLTQKGSSARDVIKHLGECKDQQFPAITKDRHLWSFNNGVFHSKMMDPSTGKYVCKFYKYDEDEINFMNPTTISSKYFDKNFNTYDHLDWKDIPTPHFQMVLDYQDFDTEVKNWMYVMGGRLCFEVSELDSWQIIPFLKGIARSGKSTLITKVFKKFYDSDDVRTLSNNIERKFGLSSIWDGFMFIAPEVKGDLCLEQAEFQSLVSGEDVSIAQKYEKAKSFEWKTPGILGGNEIPNWKDNSGSVLRRMLPWNFSKQVQEADPHMDDKLDKELPAILLKCVKAYLEYSQKYSDQDIWNVVPEYFKIVQNQVAMVTNSLQNFLSSEKIKYDKDIFCPQKIFVQIFNQHCQENNLGKVRFNPDFYVGPFSSRKLVVKSESVIYKGRAYPVQPVIYGVDIIEDTFEFSNDI